MSNRAVDILYQAKQNDIEIVLNEDQLHLKLPKNRPFDRALIDEIKASKQFIIDFLKNGKKDTDTYTQIEPFNRQAISRIPLSFSQERLWFVDKKNGSVQYHSPSILRLKGRLDVPALENALQHIVERHQVLRSVFVQEGGQVYQQIQSNQNWQLTEVNGVAFKEEALQQYIHQCVSKPFNLASDFMLRAVLIQLSNEEHVLVVTMHHIASDAWSLSILVKEVAELYSAYTNGRQAALAPLILQYADYAVWQRNQLQPATLNKKLDYWKQKLEGVATLQMPSDTLRAGATDGYGASFIFKIDKELSNQLHTISRREGTSLYMTLLAVYNILLYRYSGQPDICVGTSVANRQQQELEGLVGFFVNTLALRNQVNGKATFKELLHQVRTTTLEAYDHLDVPFEKVVEAVVKERTAGVNPLFQVMLVLHNTPEVSQLQLGDVTLSGEPYESELSKFDLTFFVTETADGLQVLIQYNAHLFSGETIGQMAAHFTTLLHAVVQSPEEKIGLLPMLGKEEQQRLLSINRKDIYYPKDTTVVHLFEEQAFRTPDATAIVFEKTVLTFAELNAKANQLAHYLRQKGVREGSLVPLYLERGLHLLTGILGIMKAGAAYVPIDTGLPADRIAFMLEDTNASVIVSSSNSRSKLSAIATIKMVEIDGTELATQPAENIQTSLTALHPAYVIYTSGSTGNPKGVIVEHRSLVDYVFGLNQSIPISHCRNYALVSTIVTDLGNTVIFSSLLLGGALHVFAKESVSNAAYLHRYFKENSIDCLKIVPSHWRALSPDDALLLPAKLLIFGGEALPAGYVHAIQEAGAGCTIVNHYGPTETTIGKLLHVVDKAQLYQGTIPIGKPFSNTQVYVLTNQLQLCPAGVLGQLYISGDGLAKGYLNNAALTNQKFIANPFEPGNGSLMYATGDLVKYGPSGDILFAGRIDNQIKIRGYRVEVSEVENTLRQSDLVQQAVVVAKDSKQDNKRLVAYVVPAGYFDREGITEFLQGKLPEYMVPYMLMELESLPLTANGKVNYKALPDPEALEQENGKYVAPQNETEKSLATIWEEILEVEQVGIHDDFFELGGHSLLAIRLISAIRKSMGAEVSIGAVFDYPTIASLATQLHQPTDAASVPAVTVLQSRPAEIPLSFSQERLWFIHQMEGSVQYHVPAVLRLKGHLNQGALSAALQTIVNRHEVLRTVVQPNNGQPCQYVKESGEWQMTIINGTDYKDDRKKLQAYVENLISQPFDLTKDDMLRAHLLCFAADDNLLVLTLHHIASDGWSKSVLVGELVELYNAQEKGRRANLKTLPVQYADYALWQRTYLQGGIMDKKLGYWKEKLTGVQALDLPTDFARPRVKNTQGAIHHFTIDKNVTEKLREISHQHGATLYMALLSVFNVLLYRYSGQEDICVGTPVAGRQQAELEGLIGFFVNTLALRMQVDGEVTFTDLLQQVKMTTLEAYEHQEVPFEKVVDVVVNERDLSRNPLFQVMFILRNTPDIPELHLGNVALSRAPHEHSTSLFDISLFITETANGLNGALEYSTALYHASGIERMAGHFIQLLASVVEMPDNKIDQLELLTTAEKLTLVSTFNHTTTDYPAHKRIIELFEEQVQKSPLATALVFNQEQLSYQLLDEKAGHLAGHLQSLGLAPQALVPICIERSIDMIAGILGILKAGGVYVPIDPEYPNDRIQHMLNDTGAGIIVSSSSSRSKLGTAENVKIVELDTDWPFISRQPQPVQPVNTQHSNPLVYVIYTSGSTGIPKGVQMPDSAMVNLLQWQQQQFGLKQRRVLQFASLTFDVSFQEIFSTLCFGSTLYLIQEDRRKDMAAMLQDISLHHITHLFIPYIVLQTLAEFVYARIPSTVLPEEIIVAGEQLRLTEDIRTLIKNGNVKLINQYGPTEAHVVSSYVVTEQSAALPPIGKPVYNTQLYVLNSSKQLCPVGIPGELYIGGAQVAKGYLNRTALTAEKFIPDAFDNKSNGQLYKTGDVARWLTDGNLEYIGRKDEQVKIRGYRVEPGEVETVLQQSNQVSQGIVVAVNDSSGNKQLVAYVVAKEAFNQKETMAYLRQKLPEYMVPALWVQLEKMPVTPNGKIDKKALPDPDKSRQQSKEYVAPQTKTEMALAAIWQQLLNIEKPGIHDNFFEMGGHSLMAMRVVAYIEKEISVSVPIYLLFQFATISELSKYIDVQTNGTLQRSNTKVFKVLDV